jgi:hypothetical protein
LDSFLFVLKDYIASIEMGQGFLCAQKKRFAALLIYLKEENFLKTTLDEP